MLVSLLFFFNDTATTEIYTLSLHDALPIWYRDHIGGGRTPVADTWWQTETGMILITPLPGVTTLKPGSATRPFPGVDRKSTRLNSSHANISYAVFCLKKKNKIIQTTTTRRQ